MFRVSGLQPRAPFLNSHSLFSLLADLQTPQKNGGVEVFLKDSLSKMDFYICFSYRTLDVNSKTEFSSCRPCVLSTDSVLEHFLFLKSVMVCFKE